MSFRKNDILKSAIQVKLAASFLIIIIIWTLAMLCVPVLEQFLVIDSPLPHADALVVMAGETSIRLPAAARLYKEKRADKIILTNDGIFSSWSNEKQRNLYEVEWAEQSLMKMQVPEMDIVKLPYTASGSIHDALNTRTYILKGGIKSIIIVTSDYHSRRSLWTFEQVYRNQPLKIGVYPVRSSLASLSDNKKLTVLTVEMFKFLYYRLRFISIGMNAVTGCC